MPGLLVSVRSAEEAVAAVLGGASVVDVKEPDRGPLGPATEATWRAVRAAVPPSIPVSVALGELADFDGGSRDYSGIAYRKLGLAGSGPRWAESWAEARSTAEGSHPGWIAVAYADWTLAGAPDPDAVLRAAIEAGDCVGLLVDTWDKSRPTPLEVAPAWIERVERARRSGLLVALAGGLDLAAIGRLAPLAPDLFAVRGAACGGSDRLGRIDPARVARLARAASARPDPSPR